ncbi:hypothetical protein BTVI_30441 [Pitangus sulphuratus]|nr:hypothetical protein BTVI_30441 [Pitangus sulphuratus]
MHSRPGPEGITQTQQPSNPEFWRSSKDCACSEEDEDEEEGVPKTPDPISKEIILSHLVLGILKRVAELPLEGALQNECPYISYLEMSQVMDSSFEILHTVSLPLVLGLIASVG